jgi:hypothetical protein
VLSAHASMLGEFAELVGPVDADSPLDDFLRSLAAPDLGATDDARR